MNVKCPTCGQMIEWTPANQYRPFCSERCRLIDLGDWFNETNTISSEDGSVTSELTKVLTPEELALLDED